MKYFYSLSLAIVLPFFSNAQTNFKPGYVINNKGDTLKGYIDYRGWDANPKVIDFKIDLNTNKIKKLTIHDITFFNIEGVDSYQKFVSKISMDGTNINHLGYAKDTSYTVDTVFFTVLQKGKNLALYSYTDQLKTRFFLGEYPDFTPKELVYRIYYNSENTKNNNRNTILEGNTLVENTYLKQLFAAANKYNSLDDNLSRLFDNGVYKDYYLLEIVSKINQFKKQKNDKRYESKVNFFAGAGLNISNTIPDKGASFALGGGKSFTSSLPLISGGINLIPKPQSGKVELRLEVLSSLTKFDSEYNLVVSPFTSERANYNQLNISFLPQFIYNVYNQTDFKIFIGAGLSLTHYTFWNSYFGVNDSFSSDNGLGKSKPFYFNAYDGNFIFKVGIKTGNKFAYYVNIITGNIINTDGYFNFTNYPIHVGFLYFFGK